MLPLRRSQPLPATARVLELPASCFGVDELSEIAVDLEITAHHGYGDPLVVISGASLPRRPRIVADLHRGDPHTDSTRTRLRYYKTTATPSHLRLF